MKEFKDYYRILGIRDNSSVQDANTAFLKKIEKLDDIRDDASRREFELLEEARRILTDPLERAIYNLKYNQHYFSQMFNDLGKAMNRTAEDAERALDARKSYNP